ncbi:MAG: bifunctional diaminohydroxyphosphoribosylaminopyrimidine deaminase/5-amino-6-(5-phosphoribosylamino)uracil reductase RibD [Muribaculaceae bacterium]|nr:bifunctional diaminohydroxyphosphoribosylaminopyrimidine deaminase/5-amino-6-(5-phosphoribosylamino)uracil reductase RibD [Muribaculaceae bacterium]
MKTSEFSDHDYKMMRRAIQLARYGEGFTSPNPMVGAVVCAPDGRIIGEGWHRRYGEGHAEVNAIASVKEADRHLLPEATVYVTLEPCSHYGKTPPCAKLLIDNKVRRVVVGSSDPFPEVSGRGISMLRDAGITVNTGLLEKECKALNPRFLTAHSLHRPYILLKWAQSADGFIAVGGDAQRVIFSSPLGMMDVHRLRASSDAILVGVNTVIADNPRLDTRLWPGRSPRPITAQSPRLPADSNLMKSDPILRNPDETLSEFLNRLYKKEKITSLIVEGGTITLEEFIRNDLFDEIRIEISPVILRNGVPAPSLALNSKALLSPSATTRCGSNLIFTLHPKSTGSGEG